MGFHCVATKQKLTYDFYLVLYYYHKVSSCTVPFPQRTTSTVPSWLLLYQTSKLCLLSSSSLIAHHSYLDGQLQTAICNVQVQLSIKGIASARNHTVTNQSIICPVVTPFVSLSHHLSKHVLGSASRIPITVGRH